MASSTQREAPAHQVPSAARILFVSTSYPHDANDWRGIFMRHLVFALARRPDVSLSAWMPPGEVPAEVHAIATAEESRWLGKLMAAGGISHLMRTGGVANLGAPLRLLAFLARAYRRHGAVDVYHINWLQCALPLPADGKPVLLTVLGNDLKLLRLPMMRTLLRRTMRGRRVLICPNADWMQAPLAEAFGDLAEIIAVPFGIDPAWYGIVHETTPTAPGKWLAVLRLTRDKLGDLFEWSEPHFRASNRELHLFGPNQENIAIPDWVHYHGAATADQLARDWFPRAQGLITLSRHAEGRPQVMLEAMAAGLPIIASNLPAHANLVEPGVTGRLCDSPAELGEALRTLEDPDTNRRAGTAARTWARTTIGTWDDCAERYAKLYRHLLRAPADD